MCTTVLISLAITGVPATTASTWHMTDTTVWVSKGGVAPIWWGRRKRGQKELNSFKGAWAASPVSQAREDWGAAAGWKVLERR